MTHLWNHLAPAFSDFARKRPRFTAYDALIDLVRAQGARNMLDYGCGPGHFLIDYAAALNIPLTGYDNAAEMVALAQGHCAHLKNTHITGDFATLPPHGFDAIAQTFVWVTWESDEACVKNLRECAAALNKDGRLYTVVSHPFFRNHPFSGFETHLPDKDLMRDGAPFTVTIKADGQETSFTDTHWTLTAMFSQINRAGLRVESLHEYPDINPQRYPGSPFLMLVASPAL